MDLSLFDFVGVWVVVIDTRGRIVRPNRACVDALGYTAEEVRGEQFWELFSEAPDRERVREELGRLREGGMGVDVSEIAFDASVLSKAGDRHFAGWSVRRIAGGGAAREEEIFAATGVDRTAWKRAVEELAWSERIVASSQDAIVSTTLEGTIRSWNPAAARIFGFTAGEAIGHPIGVIYPEGKTEERDHVITRMMNGESVTEYDTLRQRKDGSVFPVAMTGSLIRSRDGELLGILAICRDITESKRAQEAQAWLANIVSSSGDAIISTDLEGVVKSWNPAAEQIYGYSAGEMIGRSSETLFPEDRREERRALLEGLREGRALTFETVRRRRDGSLVPVLLTASPLQDRNGRVVGTSNIVRDLRERNELRARLDEERRWLRQVIDSAPVGIVLVDAARRLNANLAAQRILGLRVDPERTQVRCQARLRRGDGAPLDEAHLFELHPTDGPVLGAGEIHAEQPDGTTLVTVANVAQVLDARHRVLGSVLVFTDITALHETEAHLRRAVRSRDEILGVVAHDLRNPLNSVGLWARKIQDALARGQAVTADAVERILRSAMRMNRMITDLLDIAALDAGTLAVRRARVAPARLLAELRESQAALAVGTAVEVQLELRDSLPDVWADPDRLLQVLENLLGNALKFTTEGGRITIGAEAHDDAARFWVADTGAGLPADQLPHLFERFWQADRTDRRGAGLGLAIVKGLIEAQGGHVWAESRVGEGTTVSFTVPLAPAVEG